MSTPGRGDGRKFRLDQARTQISAVAAEDMELPVGAWQPQLRLIDADARKILKKVEFYFTDINLATTKHLMKFLTKDPDGFVPISVIADLTNIREMILAAALCMSSKLVISEDRKKVKRLEPFVAEEVQSRIVVAENLPLDHKHQTLVNIFSAVGSVKSICICHPRDGAATAASNTSRIVMPFAKPLAFVEYASAEDAEKAVCQFTGDGEGRDGIRVHPLLGCLKHELADILDAQLDPQVLLEDVKKVLLKTPSGGFALFEVDEFVMKEDKDLSNLIQKFCKCGEELIVEDHDLKVSIEEKLDVLCTSDGDTVRELTWGLKNVLHEFIPQEKDNITTEYSLPLSKELIKALEYYLINISTKMLDSYFVSTFGYLCYLDMNLKAVAKDLRNLYDRFVEISETVEDDFTYAKLLAIATVPEFVQQYDFCKTLSPEQLLKLEQAKKFISESEETDFSWYDIKRIVGSLNYLFNAPKLRDELLTRVKLMEASRFQSEVYQMIYDMRISNGYEASQKKIHPRDHVDFKGLRLRRTLLETPSGFAIFDIHEAVFQDPKRVWTYFLDTCDARNVAFALGFVKIEDKSVAWNNVTQSNDKLRNLILRFCKNKELFVQNSEIKVIIETKLHVRCVIDEMVYGDLMWGLWFVLSDFILEESDNLTGHYYLPLSNGLQRNLENYFLLPKKIDRDFKYTFGHLVNLDKKLKAAHSALGYRICERSKKGSALDSIASDHWFTMTNRLLRYVMVCDSLSKYQELQEMLSELEQLVDIPVFYVIRASRMVDICHQKVLALEDLRHWDDNTKRSCSVHGDLGQLVADDDKTEGAIFDNVADYVSTPLQDSSRRRKTES